MDEFTPCDACHVARAQVEVLDTETGAQFTFCGHHFDEHADALYVWAASLLVDDYRDRLVEQVAAAKTEGVSA